MQNRTIIAVTAALALTTVGPSPARSHYQDPVDEAFAAAHRAVDGMQEGWPQWLRRDGEPGGGGREGMDAALRLCKGLDWDHNRLACVNVVRPARFFSVEAVDACSSVFPRYYRTECLGIVMDKWYAPGLAKVCKAMDHVQMRFRCLQESSATTAHRTRPPGPGLEAAMLVCENLTFSDHKLSCLRAIQHANHFSQDAVMVCANMAFPNDKIGCLSVIKDKLLEPAVVRLCSGMTFPSEQIGCLRQN